MVLLAANEPGRVRQGPAGLGRALATELWSQAAVGLTSRQSALGLLWQTAGGRMGRWEAVMLPAGRQTAACLTGIQSAVYPRAGRQQAVSGDADSVLAGYRQAASSCSCQRVDRSHRQAGRQQWIVQASNSPSTAVVLVCRQPAVALGVLQAGRQAGRWQFVLFAGRQ